ncbi:MAG: protein arginine kinase [Candidatus Eisenbacteria bacterium]
MWTPETMMSRSAGWLDASGRESDVVLSTRVRLARNLAGEKFPCCSSDEEANSVRERVLAAMSKSNYMTNALVLRMEDVDPLTRRVLVERHLVSAAFAEDGAGRAAVAGEGELVSAMVNEEDHLRLQCIRSGLTPVDAWRLVERIDSELERNLHYAFCSDWGYLTACPTNVGTGMRVSVLIHLAGLSRTGRISQVLKSIGKLGLSVRGCYGEGSTAQGGFFQVSNQTTLGQSEEDIANTIERVAARLVKIEHEARAELVRTDEHRLEDEVWRARGTVANARLISSAEFMELASSLRLGVALGIIDAPDLAALNRLLVATQPGHLSRTCGGGTSARERDIARADLVRRSLAGLN